MSSNSSGNNGRRRTLRNLRLKPGTGYQKALMNAEQPVSYAVVGGAPISEPSSPAASVDAPSAYLNSKQPPRRVSVTNFFPKTEAELQTARPTVSLSRSSSPGTGSIGAVSTNSLFSEPTQPSPFNLSPRNLQLRARQAAAVENAKKTGVLSFPMNYPPENRTPSVKGGRRKKGRKTRGRKTRGRKQHKSRKHRR
jgi:hypothetical protein